MALGTWTSEAEQGAELSRWVRRARGGDAVTGARLITVAGGKGGVGKSNFCLNFGLALAARGLRVRLVDCDAGLGSLDVLLGMTPRGHLGQVLAGCALEEVELAGPLGVRIVPAPPEVWEAGLAPVGEALLAAVLAAGVDVVLLDAGGGLGEGVRSLLALGREVVVVTTPEPTALADAYATLKAVRHANASAPVGLVLNLVECAGDGEAAFRAVASVCRSYLDWSPVYVGAIPRDPAVRRAVRAQRPLLLDAPQAPAARALRQLASEFGARGPGA